MPRAKFEDKHPEVTYLVFHLRHRRVQAEGGPNYLTTRSYSDIAEALRQRGYAAADGRPLSPSTINRILHRGAH